MTTTLTATITVTDFANQPTGKDAPWPTGAAGLPTGFYATTTVCSSGCAATPVTVTVTIPVPTGGITKTIAPTPSAPAANSGKPSSSAAAFTPSADGGKPGWGSGVSTPVAATSDKTPAAATASSANNAWVTGDPIGGYNGGNGIKPFTGGAAAEQAPATVLSVAVCLVLAITGLVL